MYVRHLNWLHNFYRLLETYAFVTGIYSKLLFCYRSGKKLTNKSVSTYNVDHKSNKELRQYLSNIADQCEQNSADLPSVIILDNLHHVASLGEVFDGFLSVRNRARFVFCALFWHKNTPNLSVVFLHYDNFVRLQHLCEILKTHCISAQLHVVLTTYIHTRVLLR